MLAAVKTNTTVRLTTTKQYDYSNRLLSVVSSPSSSASLPISHAYSYNDVNQRIRASLSDGSFWVYQLDSLGQVESGKKYWSDWTPVAGQQFEYSFDDIGNRSSTKAGGDAMGTSLRSATYSANSLNQYASRSVPNGLDITGIGNSSATVTVNSQSVYRRAEYYQTALTLTNGSGAVWQSVTVSATNGGSSSNITGNAFLPQTPESYGYDPDGNLASDGRWTYTLDGENRLTSMQSLSSLPSGAKRQLDFTYDSTGRRIQKIMSTWSGSSYVPQSPNTFLYDGWNLLAELDGGKNLVRSYQWGLDLSGSIQGAGGVGGLLAIKPTTGNQLFVAYDGNGNVTGLIDATTGTTTGNFEYGPFGETIRLTPNANNQSPFRFSTKYTDDESDFLYYGYRYYNPNTGRWLGRDLIDIDSEANPYAFLLNGPANALDPFGLQTVSAQFVVSAKTWINFPINPGYVRGMPPHRYPLLLAMVALLRGAISDVPPADGTPDGRYRLYSSRIFGITCCEYNNSIIDWSAGSFSTDSGLEGPDFFQISPADLIVERVTARKIRKSCIRFTWRARGAPHRLAEVAFQVIRSRTSRFIWHYVDGIICCINGQPRANVTISGSRFPSHDVFVNDT